jgi:hypothetical protein
LRRIIVENFEADPSSSIITHDDDHPLSITEETLDDIPDGEEEFNQTFKPFHETQTNDKNRLVICVKIATNGKMVNDLKHSQ